MEEKYSYNFICDILNSGDKDLIAHINNIYKISFSTNDEICTKHVVVDDFQFEATNERYKDIPCIVEYDVKTYAYKEPFNLDDKFHIYEPGESVFVKITTDIDNLVFKYKHNPTHLYNMMYDRCECRKKQDFLSDVTITTSDKSIAFKNVFMCSMDSSLTYSDNDYVVAKLLFDFYKIYYN